MKWLVYGGKGWIGQILIDILEKQGHTVVVGKTRLENIELTRVELKQHQPDRVVCCVGRTHGPNKPNIDFLQNHMELNLQDNLLCQVQLAHVCQEQKIHATILGTGCIFQSSDHTEEDYGDDTPDNAYARVKTVTERLLRLYENNTMIVRIRMPIGPQLTPRDLITKLTNYELVTESGKPNSVTVLDSLGTVMLRFAQEARTGVINLVNRGSMTHTQILTLYKEVVDPDFTWKTMTVEEQSKVIACARSNCTLSTEKLEYWASDSGIRIPTIEEDLRRVFSGYN